MHLHTPLPDLLKEGREADRRYARTFSRAMLLRTSFRSPEGASLVAELVDTVLVPFRKSQGQYRPTMGSSYTAITTAFLADLLRAAQRGRWSTLSTENGHLGTVPGGRSAFGVMRAAMGAAGLLDELPGYHRTYTVFGHEQSKASWTCFRPTSALLELAVAQGVPLEEVSAHLRLPKLAPPGAEEVLTVLAKKKADQSRPKRLPTPKGHPKAAAIIQDMERLNAFLMEEGRVDGITFSGLRRSFNNADQDGFDFQWHGRFYSMPAADHYESLEGGKATRQQLILIDGKPAREVDVSASHLTILHGLLGVPFDPVADPYELPGVNRNAVKDWLMIALGSSGEKHGGNRLKAARLAGEARYPFLRDLPKWGIGPLDLHYHEAEILHLAMRELIAEGIGFLPVHDALLVAEGNEEMAAQAVRQAFDRYFRGRLRLPSAPIPRLHWG